MSRHAVPVISGALIVKDEQDVLDRCLTALRPFVDEIVVYDTGSTDRTRDIARENGATVIEGYWNDDFGDARDRSLEHCRGDRVLFVDADEVATGDPATVRARISGAAEASLLVGVENLLGHTDQVTERGLQRRLFRRARGRFAGRVHEQVVDRVTGQSLDARLLPELTLRHSGYTPQRMATKDKAQRNLHLAELALGDQDGSAAVLMELARGQLSAGRPTDAIETCHKGLTGDAATPAAVRVMLPQTLIHACIEAGRLEPANVAVAQLRDVATVSVTADEREARIRSRRATTYRTGHRRGVPGHRAG